MREAAIVELQKLRTQAAEVKAAAQTAERGASFTELISWQYLIRSSRAIRSGDGMERVIALIGPPLRAQYGFLADATGGRLVYRGRSNSASKSNDTLELSVQGGKVVEIRIRITDADK